MYGSFGGVNPFIPRWVRRWHQDDRNPSQWPATQMFSTGVYKASRRHWSWLLSPGYAANEHHRLTLK